MDEENEVIEIFYVGRVFYERSRYGAISSVYYAGTYERCDWGKVQVLLGQGKNVYIRQATLEELMYVCRLMARNLGEEATQELIQELLDKMKEEKEE